MKQQLIVSARRLMLMYVGWWLLLVVVETYALSSTFGFGVGPALVDAININLLVATAGYVMFNALRFYQPSPRNAFYLVIWSIGLATICTLLHNYLMAHAWMRDNAAYLAYLDNSELIRGLFAWLMITLISLISWIWFYLQEQRDAEKRQEDAVKLAREAELASLRQQLQPHFLFNSLNSISALAGSRPEEARRMIQQLSDFLRGTIKKDDQQLVTLEDELKHLQLYLDIEKVRFGHRLKTEIDIAADTATMMLPSLLLQPVVENAIKFGLYDTIGEITIRLSAQHDGNELAITIQNPFDPETSQPKPGTGFGLSSVQRRLYLLYARQDLVTTTHEGTLFHTEVKIPQRA